MQRVVFCQNFDYLVKCSIYYPYYEPAVVCYVSLELKERCMQLLSPVNHPCFHLSVSFQQLLNGNGQLEFCKFLLKIVMKDISNENQWSFVFSVKVCVTRLLSKSSKYN